MIADLTILKSLLTPLSKSILLPLGLPAEMSAVDAAYGKKIYTSSTTALIISNEEMEHIIKIVKSLEESGLLIKGITEKIKNKAKGQKGGFLKMLLGALAASMSGNALTRREVITADEGTDRRGENF